MESCTEHIECTWKIMDKYACTRKRKRLTRAKVTEWRHSGQYWWKWFEVPNLFNGFLTKYHGSLNNPSQANGDFREQIFACDCNNSGETEEVFRYITHKLICLFWNGHLFFCYLCLTISVSNDKLISRGGESFMVLIEGTMDESSRLVSTFLNCSTRNFRTSFLCVV